jgi:hypothetical protein
MMGHRIARSLYACATLLGSAHLVYGQGSSLTECQYIVPNSVAPGDALGWSISADGARCAIGAMSDDIAHSNNGSVYV